MYPNPQTKKKLSDKFSYEHTSYWISEEVQSITIINSSLFTMTNDMHAILLVKSNIILSRNVWLVAMKLVQTATIH